ncbi:MAG: 16S rRNA (cytidine(1402)-2'-O)-methyltransferase [Rickettsiales bacterium]|nr:MAG: 16S rRNA (cytidine(1402)-2'-O)-methyltransferase [Rickettsiales bacterium]
MIFKSGLYIVSTPIGNLDDITLRALETLKNSDVILCEDTRVSHKLLAKYNIKAILRVYNDSSDAQVRDYVQELIASGKVVSLISDAGTPLISDPGFKLVRDLKNSDIHIDIVPGPCAAIAALTLSGLPTDKFFFAGFLPKTREGKIAVFKSCKNLGCTIIFYDTAKRLLSSLEVAHEIMGNRAANVARELTKLYQESKTGSLLELIDHYKQNTLKGEIVLSISGETEDIVSLDNLHLEIEKLLSENMSAKNVTEILYEQNRGKFSRGEIYKLVNQLKADN